MPDDASYVPLSDRLNQDVWHDNFVPKYSAIATAKPTRLVLVGVWMIFGSMALGAIGTGLSMIADSLDMLTAILSSILPALFFVLAVVILVTQTRRYTDNKRETERSLCRRELS